MMAGCVNGCWVAVGNNSSLATLIACKQDLEGVCFGGETPILNKFGSFSKIENLQIGDLVMSRSELTGEMAPKRILKIYERSALLYGVTYNSGPEHDKSFGPSRGIANVTGEHPFWVQGRGWVEVRNLKSGDALLSYNDDPTTVEFVLTPEERDKRRGYPAWPSPVYNLEVEDFNTYFVDTPGVWVHNCNRRG